MNNAIKFFDDMAEVDLAGEYQAGREMELDEAKEAIIQILLADEDVSFSRDEKWTIEELLSNYLQIPERKLQQFIDYEKEL